ncbi:glycosyltransferase [Dasania marina]|uniref:glycosyltransferase n=1 Tax=Dasania marina TaxID=471499 RepID=UPI0030DC2AB4|tara:strand:+ start:89247 stop:90209 length:963 start_codon:yes stop_codon:yes gene_type:complete
MSRLWITWEVQRRNKSISKALNAKLIELDIKGGAAGRYLKAIFISLRALRTEQPRQLFVQNPSIVLATLAVFIGIFSKIKIVVDAHNSGIRPLEGRSKFINSWSDFLLRRADLTIVTNNALFKYVESKGGQAVILPDALPELIKTGQPIDIKTGRNVLFICSWAEDEPYLNVLEAAALLDTSINIYITGNWQKCKDVVRKDIPSNVVLTGFVSESYFDGLLSAVDVVMDLTTRDDCLLCGAYEGVAAGRVMVLTDTPVLREYFNSGVVYTDNTSQGIAQSIKVSFDDFDRLSEDVVQLRQDISKRWGVFREELERRLELM